MSASLPEQRVWPRWFRQQQPPPVSYRLDYHTLESPPRELPDLVYSSEFSSPSNSSSSHLHLPFNNPVLISPSLSSEPAQSNPQLPSQKTRPNKLRKLSVRKPSNLGSVHPTLAASDIPVVVPVPSSSQSLLPAPSTLSSASNPNVCLHRTTSTPTVNGARSSLSTERATLYSRSSQVPLISSPIRTVTRTVSLPQSRKLTKQRPAPTYLSLDHTVPSISEHSATVLNQSHRRLSLNFNFMKSKSSSKFVKKSPSQRLSRLETSLPNLHYEDVSLDEASLTICYLTFFKRYQLIVNTSQPLASESISVLRSSSRVPSVERLFYSSPSSSVDGHQSSESWSPHQLYTEEYQFNGNDSNDSSFSPVRPPLIRRNALTTPDYERLIRPRPRSAILQGSVRRRWSLAMAMTDDGITDEVFVQELERLRQEWHGDDADLSGSEDDHSILSSHIHSNDHSIPSSRIHSNDHSILNSHIHSNGHSILNSHIHSNGHSILNSHIHSNDHSISSSHIHSNVEDPGRIMSRRQSQSDRDANWPSALRALLITRDLLRTERNYLNSLHRLLSSCPCALPSDFPLINQNSQNLPWPKNPPPEVMLTHLLSLIRASTLLINRIHQDPTVWGVSSAFVLAEEQMMSAYCGWCSEVGDWYTESDGTEKGGRRLSRARFSGDDIKLKEAEQEPSSPGLRKKPTSLTTSGSSSSVTSHFSRKRETKWKGQILTVRELAILPVQRVVRYVLLFRGKPSSNFESHSMLK